MSRPNAPRPRTVSIALIATATALVLSACGGTGAQPPAASGGTDAPATAGPGPSDSAAPTPEPTEEPIPFEAACDEILTLDQLYAYNASFGTAPEYEPTATTIRDVAAAEGTACGYLNQTSGDLLEIGVATLPEHAYELQVGDAALHSKAVPTYGTPPDVEGFFRRSGDVGQAQVFSDGYWIVVESPALFEPGDAQGLVAVIVGNLAGS
ncbi:hypothetical protein GCM10009819_27050 [Agromyces tropicus]|uniref:Iron ABC transporter ATP-binding protein n=1 Tax=Agromyces tropicus TaxID=555371 RepID=A0ABN2UP05_9MICO